MFYRRPTAAMRLRHSSIRAAVQTKVRAWRRLTRVNRPASRIPGAGCWPSRPGFLPLVPRADPLPRLSPAGGAEPVNSINFALPRGIILGLLLLALALSIAVQILQIRLGTTGMSVLHPGMYEFEPYASKILGLLRLASTGCALAGGLLACLQSGFSILGLGTRLVIGIYALAASVWLMIGILTMPIREFLGGDNSPLIWLLCLVVFAGAQREVWNRLPTVAGVVAWLLVPLMFDSLMKVKYYGRFQGGNPQVRYLSLGLCFAQYLLLATPGTSLFRRSIRAVPLLTCTVVAVFAQGRGWLVQCVLAFALLAARPLALRQAGAGARLARDFLLGLVLAVVVSVLLLRLYPLAVEGLLGRVTQDTRSEQYREFFSQVDLAELVPGKGPLATYRLGVGADLDYAYFDNQFIVMAFRGGLLIALGYTALVLVPGFRLLLRGRDERQYAAGATLVLWGLALAGLCTYNDVNFTASNLFICLLAGYAHANLPTVRAARCIQSDAKLSVSSGGAPPGNRLTHPSTHQALRLYR